MPKESISRTAASICNGINGKKLARCFNQIRKAYNYG